METKISKVRIKVKGHKKFIKNIRKMRRELEKLNSTMERTDELKQKSIDSSRRIKEWFS